MKQLRCALDYPGWAGALESVYLYIQYIATYCISSVPVLNVFAELLDEEGAGWDETRSDGVR